MQERKSETSPVSAPVDPGVITQVVENLVSNAVKYSAQGKNIFVGLKRTPEGVRFLTLLIEVTENNPAANLGWAWVPMHARKRMEAPHGRM